MNTIIRSLIIISTIVFLFLVTFIFIIQPWNHGSTQVSKDDQDETIVGVLTHPEAIILFQKGRFNCKKEERRTILVLQGWKAASVGCSENTQSSIKITWEDGQVVEIGKDTIDSSKVDPNHTN